MLMKNQSARHRDALARYALSTYLQAKRKHARTRDDGTKRSRHIQLQLAEQARQVYRLVDLVTGKRSFEATLFPA